MQWIRRCRPWGGPPSDVRIEQGQIAEITPHRAGTGASDTPGTLDGRDRLLLPAFTDTHCHLDSNRVGLPFRPHTGVPGVWAMTMNDRAQWRNAEAPITERTTSLLGRMIAHGAGTVRSFAQVDVDCGLERLEAVLTARETHRERVQVQVVAFPQAGLLRENGSERVLEDAIRSGADVVGGIDPSQLDRDPVRHLDIVFGLADQYGVPVDIHLHEPGELARFTTSLIIERTEALGMQGQVLISHGFGLFTPDAGLPTLIDDLARADIALSTVAPGSAPPLPLSMLTEHGIRVGLGQDGQRDYWSPYGNGDMLDRTWQLAFTQGYRPDELVEYALAVASSGGRSIVHGSPRLRSTDDRPGVSVGDPADLLLVGTEAVTAAVMDRPQDRTVLHRGRVVADGLALTG